MKEIDMEKVRIDKGKQKERANTQYTIKKSSANVVKDMNAPGWK